MPSFRAVTIIIGLRLETGSTISARIWLTVVVVILAFLSRKANRTYAFKSINLIDTFAPIFARISGTIVYVCSTVATCVTWLTSTVVIVYKIYTRSSMLTLPYTVIDVLITILSHPTNSTFAMIISY